MNARDVAEHRWNRVEQDVDGFVLVCRCGWRSEPSKSAETVGVGWDAHREAAESDAGEAS